MSERERVPGRFEAAVAAGLLPAEEAQRELLQSIVELARRIFAAKAVSIQRYDERSDELVFEAVAGEGSETLVGQRYPSSQGIAGWVLVSGQQLVIDDVVKDPRFARDFAESTGFVPTGMMSAPLIEDERTLGVMQVLDRRADSGATLQELELLSLFAAQAAVALEFVVRLRRAGALVEGGEADVSAVARVSAALDVLEGSRRQAGVRLLQALEEVLRRR